MSAALLTLVFALAALLHGIAGIGFPLVLTSVLSLQMGMKEAVVLTAIPILLVNIISMVSGSAVKPVLQKYVLLAISSVLEAIAFVTSATKLLTKVCAFSATLGAFSVIPVLNA